MDRDKIAAIAATITCSNVMHAKSVGDLNGWCERLAARVRNLTRTEATTGAGEVERLREAARWLVDRASHHGSHAAIDQDHIDALRDAVNDYDAALAQPVQPKTIESGHSDTHGDAMEMFAHMNCPACGGSGHIDDTARPVQDAGGVIHDDVKCVTDFEHAFVEHSALDSLLKSGWHDGLALAFRAHRLALDQLGQDEALLDALHDAIRRPMGVVPDSAVPFYDQARADAAESRRAFSRERGDA